MLRLYLRRHETPHIPNHQQGETVMPECPICQSPMRTDDVNKADHVALGLVVCSVSCHAAMYDGQLQLPFTWRQEVEGFRDDP